MLSLLDVDLVEGTTVSRHLNSKTITNVSTESYQAVTLLTCFITFFNLSRMHLLLLPWLPWLMFLQQKLPKSGGSADDLNRLLQKPSLTRHYVIPPF